MDLIVDVAGSPREFLAALERYAADWRESRVPLSLRAQGVLGCTATVRDPAFTIRLRGGGGRGPRLLCTGVAEDGPAGTRLRARVGRTAWAPRVEEVGGILVAALYGALVGAFAAGIAGSRAVGLGVGVSVFAIQLYSDALRMRRNVQLYTVEFRVLLLAVSAWAGSSHPGAPPNEALQPTGAS
jgi:hypothetical protein